jgi:branched-chain amino acid transport system substrate-binding protein
VKYWDHKSGDAAAGKQAMVEIIAGKYPAKLASYADDLFVMTPDTTANHIFTFDGGGGTSIPNQGKDYFWGTRAITPNDPLPGLFRWWKENNPGKVKVGLTGWDVGAASNAIIKTDILKKIADAGLTFNGLYELFPPGNQDFSQVLPKVQANEPDLLLAGCYGQDPGSLVNQSSTAGLKAFIVGFEFTPDGVNASKGSYDSAGWTFAYDYFDSGNPISPLAKLFVQEFKAAYTDAPDFYAANFYENTLNMWQLISRVTKKGGNILSGTDLQTALTDNLSLASVYGGDASTAGTYSLDPKTHSVLKRTMGVFQYKGGKVTPYVYFDIAGADYRKA